MTIDRRHALLLVALLAAPLVSGGAAGCATTSPGSLPENRWGRYGAEALARAERPDSTAAAPVAVSPPAKPTPERARLDQPAPQPASVPPAPAGTDDSVGEGTPLHALGFDLADVDPSAEEDDWRPGRRLKRGEAIAAFLVRSPRVSALVDEHRRSSARLDQSAYLGDLVRRYAGFSQDVRPEATFPLRGAAALRGDLAALDVAVSLVRLEQGVLAALVDFERRWQQARYWQRAATILSRSAELAARVTAAVEARYRAGRASHTALVRAQIAEADLTLRRATARAELAAARGALAAALDLPPSAFAKTRLRAEPGPPPLSARAAIREQAAGGPGVRTARLAQRRAALLVELAERQQLPTLSESTSATPAIRAPLRGGRPAAAKASRFAIGGPFVEELRHALASASARQRQAERSAPAAADEAWVALDDAVRRRRLLLGDQAARATEAVAVAERAYRSGAIDYVALDSAVRLELDIALRGAAATRDAYVAAARLRQFTGTGSQRRVRP